MPLFEPGKNLMIDRGTAVQPRPRSSLSHLVGEGWGEGKRTVNHPHLRPLPPQEGEEIRLQCTSYIDTSTDCRPRVELAFALKSMIVTTLLLAMLLASGCAVASSDPEQVSRVSVIFVDPERFTDVKRSNVERSSAGLLKELQKFMIETGERYVPAQAWLSIHVTDVDLAGDFELFRGPHFDHVRITKGLYPPRIALEFRLTDDGGRIIKEGKRDLIDIDYQLRSVYPKEDYLRYEKDMLRDWLRVEFGVPKAGKTS
jgi:hypothetical protein